MTEPHLPPDFCWGVATSAFQIEGAWDADGKAPSVWDTLAHLPGRIAGGATGDVTCDHYHRLTEDLDLLAELGVTSYRFSVSWPRVRPTGTGAWNPAGVAFYDRLVDGLLEHGIEPTLTLYHWDHPQALEEAGGWTSRDTAYAFADYAAGLARMLGDRVTRWITLNEPLSVVMAAVLGHERPAGPLGPGGLATAHHLLLAHGLATQALRATGVAGEVGIALNLTGFQTPKPTPQPQQAAPQPPRPDAQPTQAAPQAAQPDPQAVHAEPPAVRADPQAVQADLQAVQASSEAVQADPQAVRADPQAVLAEPQAVQPDPQTTQADPPAVHAYLQAAQHDPQAVYADLQAAHAGSEAVQADPRGVQADPQGVQADPQAALLDPQAVRADSDAVRVDGRGVRADSAARQADPRAVGADSAAGQVDARAVGADFGAVGAGSWGVRGDAEGVRGGSGGVRADDAWAVERATAYEDRLFLDPLLLGRYPCLDGRPLVDATDADLALIRTPLDFLGVNWYAPGRVRSDPSAPFGYSRVVEGRANMLGWPVDPEGLGALLAWLRGGYPGLPPVYLTENGIPLPGDTLCDDERVDFLRRCLHQVAAAVRAGSDIRGYFVWSLLDNLEWSHGFAPRFGLVHVDFDTLVRTPRLSYHWYRNLIRATATGAGAICGA